MTLADIFGWMAGALVLTTFYLKTMVPLRCVAIASNVTFLSYGLMTGALPITVLHALLLPMNLWRLGQLCAQRARLAAMVQGEFSVSALQPFLTTRAAARGTVLIAKGRQATELIIVLHGHVLVVETGLVLGPGSILGDECAFGDDRTCSTTAVCRTEVELASIPVSRAWEAFSASPEFAARLLRMAMGRGTGRVGTRSRYSSIESVPVHCHASFAMVAGTQVKE
jgi:hypothetical protein